MTDAAMLSPRRFVLAGLLLLLGALAWLTAADRSGPPAAAADDPVAAGRPNRAAAAPPVVHQADAGAPTASEHRRDVLPDVSNGGVVRLGGQVSLLGRLVPIDGSPPPAVANVGLQARSPLPQWARNEIAHDGFFAISGLRPGEWDVTITSDDHVRIHTALVLGTEPVQTRDFALRPAPKIAVLLQAPDGRPLFEALPPDSRLQFERSLQVIATAAPLLVDLPPTERAEVGDVGVGRFRPGWNRYLGGRLRTDVDGTLVLDREPPVHTALLLRHVILQQQPIAPGQQRLVFAIDPTRLAELLSTARVRVVDSRGDPIAGAMVSIRTAQGGGRQTPTGSNGMAVLDQLLPGIGVCVVRATDREERRFDVRLPVGTTDLGAIELGDPVQLEVRLVDDEGRPMQGAVTYAELDGSEFPTDLTTGGLVHAGADGAFRLRLGPRRHVLRGMNGTMAGIVAFDGRSDVRALTIELRPAGSIEVAAIRPFRSYLARLLDAAGVVVAAARLSPREPSQRLGAPFGPYALEVFDQDDRVVHTSQIDLTNLPRRVEVW